MKQKHSERLVGLPLEKLFGRIASALKARRELRKRKAALRRQYEELHKESKYLRGVVLGYASEGKQWRERLRKKFGLTDRKIAAFLSSTALLNKSLRGLPAPKTLALDFRVRQVLDRFPEEKQETLLDYVANLKLVRVHHLPKWRALRDAMAERRKKTYAELQALRGKTRLAGLRK